ncbi:MAG: S8 family serine peptidase [Deinococcales bacterium]
MVSTNLKNPVKVEIGSNSLVLFSLTGSDVKYRVVLRDFKINGVASSAWLTATPTEGVISGQQASDIGQQPSVVIKLETNKNLSDGNYQAILDLYLGNDLILQRFNLGGNFASPIAMVNSSPINLSGAEANFAIENKGIASTTLNWNVIVENWRLDNATTDAWFDVEPRSGSLSGGQSQTVKLKRHENLAQGAYKATVTVQHDNGKSSFEVSANITGGTAYIQPMSLSFAASQSGSFGIQNTGAAGSALDWVISTRNNKRDGQAVGEWVDINPASGRTMGQQVTPVTLSLKAGLVAGVYEGELIVTSPSKVYLGGFRISAQVGGATATADFSLSYDNTTYAIPEVPPGYSVVGAPVFISCEGGFSNSISFSLKSPPAGVTATFNPATATCSSSYVAMTLAVANNAVPGDYKLIVEGQGGGKTHQTNEINFTVKGANVQPSFSLSANPVTLTVPAGGSGPSTLTINKVGGFNSNVTFSAENPPTGFTVSFNPNPSSTTTTATVAVAANVAAGTYAIPIKGVSGSLSQSVTLSLQVTRANQDPKNAKIQGQLRTDNNMNAFTVPLLGGGSAQALNALTRGEVDYVPGQILVRYRQEGLSTSALQESYQRQAAAVMRENQLELLRSGEGLTSDVISVAQGQEKAMSARLAQDSRVLYAEPNYYLYPMSLANDTEFSKQWYSAAIGLPVAWDIATSSNVIVAVLDTSMDRSHVDLQGSVFVSSGYDFCTNSTCSGSGDSNPAPDLASDQHGTHVAGLIGAVGNNSQGIAGVLRSGARLLPVKVFYQGRYVTAEALEKAIRWAAGFSVSGTPQNANPAKIINMSLGTDQDSSAIRTAVQDAANQKGVLLIAAAGNYGQKQHPLSCCL